MKVFVAVIGFVLGCMYVLAQLQALPELPATLATMNGPGAEEAAWQAAGYILGKWVYTLWAAGVAIKCGLFLRSRGRL